MIKKHDAIHFKHDVVYYIPCYQHNPRDEGDGYPTFTYDLADASPDEQSVASLSPDYVLVLKGTFDATTQPFDSEIKDYNLFRKE